MKIFFEINFIFSKNFESLIKKSKRQERCILMKSNRLWTFKPVKIFLDHFYRFFEKIEKNIFQTKILHFRLHVCSKWDWQFSCFLCFLHIRHKLFRNLQNALDVWHKKFFWKKVRPTCKKQHNIPYSPQLRKMPTASNY